MKGQGAHDLQDKLQRLRQDATSDKAKQLLQRSISTLLLSVNSLKNSCLHPYVRAKVKTCFKPILAVALGIYAVGLVLVVPVTIIAFLVHILSLGYLETRGISATARQVLYEATTFIPLISVAVLRQFVRKPLDKCFIHMLREVNPPMAQRLESGPALKDTSRQRMSSRRVYGRYVNQIGALLALEVGIFLFKRLPYVGVFAHPVAHFITVSRTLDSRAAAGFAALGLVPLAGPLVSSSMRLWRGAHVLGGEMVGDYVSKVIPHADRDAFWKRNGLTIALFMLPSLALMKVPVLGAAAVFPMAASAAWLVNLLENGSMSPDAPTAGDKRQAAPSAGPDGNEDNFFGHGGSLRQRGQPAGFQGQDTGSQGQGLGSQGGQSSGYSSGRMPQPSAPPFHQAPTI